ncbi:SH3-like domain-containing protein [Rhizobium leguminosarum]|uniref:SH3-like domain-containing protein n=1 Tax=Rhizobium leguminosarum TaxID=384 RepID=UPI00103EDAB4|nr:SH3-like domain-containing protein [Rhizobium leguminosarum]TBZ57986.1 nitrile hydratase subunit beta [Rhizobium leguminosarum bv. viciae]
MTSQSIAQAVVPALGETPTFKVGDLVRTGTRFPVGHYRLPMYLRGKSAVVERVIATMGVDNEEEGFGRNAGSKGHYYRIAISLSQIWADYKGPASDGLRVEVFENWLERI